jgi:hypothetical protein
MNEVHYGWVVNCHYDWVNMLIKMKESKPERFNHFSYGENTIYNYLDKIQHEEIYYD